MTSPCRYSVVIPVYRNAPTVPRLLAELARLAKELDAALEVVFVVDGSPDDSYARLVAQLPTTGLSAKVLLHTRNFGSFAAIKTGLAHASGEYFAVMAADLQEPIDLVATFFRDLARADVDVVYGQRVARDEPLRTRLSAGLFWRLFKKVVMPDMPEGGVDVFGCNREVRDALLRMNEANSSLVGQLFWVGFRRRGVPYSRLKREEGKSAWTFRKKVRYLSDSVYSFTDLPVRLLTWAGITSIALAFALALLVTLARWQGYISVTGYTPIILAIMFFGGLNSLGLGLVGSYVWRAYENTKARPYALVIDSASVVVADQPQRVTAERV